MASNIKQSTIRFHNGEMHPTSSGDPWQFGILEMEMVEMPFTKTPIVIVFSIDMSGSMSDIGRDRKSKMRHVKTTFKNMMTFIAESDVEVNIQVDAFDDCVEHIIDMTRVTTANLEELIRAVEKLEPRNGTNIEIALRNARSALQKYANELDQEKSAYKMFHILLTDGDANEGETDPRELSQMILFDGFCSNIFLGIGAGHNVEMMKTFAEIPRSDYRFIDSGKKAGMVYGEILQRILRPALEDVRAEMIDVDSELFDWKSCQWVRTLNEDVIDSETKRVYHIRSKNPSLIECNIFGKNCGVGEDEDSNRLLMTVSCNQPPDDLRKYMYRQRVLELLHECKSIKEIKRIRGDGRNRHFLDDLEEENAVDKIDEKKRKLAKLFRSMRKYMRANELMTDNFMRTLCEDVVVAYKTIGTSLADMHITSRENSQGRQCSCTTQVEDEPLQPPPLLRRQYAFPPIDIQETDLNKTLLPHDFDKDIENAKYQTVFSSPRTKNVPLHLMPQEPVEPENKTENTTEKQIEVDEDSIDQYILESTNKKADDMINNSAYLTPGRIQLMRAVSGPSK